MIDIDFFQKLGELDNISNYAPEPDIVYEVTYIDFISQYKDMGGDQSRNKLDSSFVAQGQGVDGNNLDCYFYLNSETKKIKDDLSFLTDLEIVCKSESHNLSIEFYLTIDNIEEINGLRIPATTQADFLRRSYRGEGNDGSLDDLFINISGIDLAACVVYGLFEAE